MITWSRLEKGYRRRRNPTSSWNLTSSPQTAGWDSAAVCYLVGAGNGRTRALAARSIWVMELTDSGMWMCVCWQTPLHSEWGLWLHLIMRAASLLSPASLSPHFSLSYHTASWAIMWSHYLTPRRSRVQLTKTARGPSCGKDSVGTQHTFSPPPQPTHPYNSSLSPTK